MERQTTHPRRRPASATSDVQPAPDSLLPPTLDLDVSALGEFVRPTSLFGSREFAQWPQGELLAMAGVNGIGMRDTQDQLGRTVNTDSFHNGTVPAASSQLKRSYSIASSILRVAPETAPSPDNKAAVHRSKLKSASGSKMKLTRASSGIDFLGTVQSPVQSTDYAIHASEELNSMMPTIPDSIIEYNNQVKHMSGLQAAHIPYPTLPLTVKTARSPSVVPPRPTAPSQPQKSLDGSIIPFKKLSSLSRIDRKRLQGGQQSNTLRRNNSMNSLRPSTPDSRKVAFSRTGSQETVRTLKNDEVEKLKNVINTLSRPDSLRNPVQHYIVSLPRSNLSSLQLDDNSADMDSQVVLTMEQLRIIAPNLPSSSEHVASIIGLQKVTGVVENEGDTTTLSGDLSSIPTINTGRKNSLRNKFPTLGRKLTLDKPSPKNEPEELFLLDLGQFLPLVQLLSSESRVTNRDEKLQLMFRILDSNDNGQLTSLEITDAIKFAVKNNGLYLNDNDRELLVDELMNRLDVDHDGTIGAQDFRLATRKWNLNTIGLPLANANKSNKDINITDFDYLAVDMPMTPTVTSFDKSVFDDCDVNSNLNTITDSEAGAAQRKSYNRKSFVRATSQWLLRKESEIDVLRVGGKASTPKVQNVSESGLPRTMPQFTAMNSGVNRQPGMTDDDVEDLKYKNKGLATDSRKANKERSYPTKRMHAYRKAIKTYMALEGLKIFWVLIFLIVCVYMFTNTYLEFISKPEVVEVFGRSLALAKGCASIIDFTVMFQFILLCRGLLTYARNIKLVERYVPIDKNIVWHRYCGALFIFAAVVHSLAHIGGTFPAISSSNLTKLHRIMNLPASTTTVPTYMSLMFISIPGWTGWALLLIIILMGFTSIARVRGHNFELFWYTHHLCILMIPLMLLHGSMALISPPKSWKFILLPVFLYTVERLLRVKRSSEKAEIVRATVENDTIALVLTKPPFIKKYISGQYIFINIPEISKLQWHPFTLTSSPNDPYLTLRIKRVGDWTGALFQKVKDVKKARQQREITTNTTVIASNDEETGIKQDSLLGHGETAVTEASKNVKPDSTADITSFPSVRIDGVFGAPSQHFFEYDHVILIATGVGITPFLSILNSIEHYVKTNKRRIVFEGNTMRDLIQMKSVDLFWLNREPKAYQWFSETLKQLYKDRDVQQWLRVHTFVTSAKGRDDIRSFLLWWGLQLISKRHGRCLLTGTEHNVSWGRPHWETVFDQVAHKYPGKKIGVFFCGPKALSKELYDLCRLQNNRGTNSTWFEYAKEIF